jgi:medium-chain acyl-[acyl-carrier-protein] hydrolase
MAISTPLDAWVRRQASNPQARLRLFCFPYAGGSASVFHSWAAALRSDVELNAVQLPGRENRLLDPPFIRLALLVEALAQILPPYLDRPYAFFGHSMGALIGFELARLFRKQGSPGPACLIVSGHRAPHLPDRRPPIHHLPDARFIEELRRLNGTPEEVLQHEELRDLLLPVLRADFAVCETYLYAPEQPLDCPIFVIGGEQDPEVSQDELAAWQLHTRGAFTLHMIPGDHFFLHSARPLLLNAVNRALIYAAAS